MATNTKPVFDFDTGLLPWSTQDQAFCDFLDGWQRRHSEEPDWDISGSALTGDCASDYVEVDVYGLESGEGLESITINAAGVISS
jgi:hypothetical protein